MERRRLEPLIALRGAAGLAFVIGVSLCAVRAGDRRQLRVRRLPGRHRHLPAQLAAAPRCSPWSPAPAWPCQHLPRLRLRLPPVLFLALLAAWTFLSGLTWAAGPTGGMIASSNVAIMLVTITLPTSVGDAAAHAAMMACSAGWCRRR